MSLNDHGPILVTGCSSGVGRAVVNHLSSLGQTVFACARKDTDLNELNILPHVSALRVDVTSSNDAQAAVEWVRKQEKGLRGLVNNAGVSGFGSLLDSTVEDLQRVYDVNLYGIHRMTKAFAPFLIESRGRIVNVSSVSGFLIERFWGAYNISKHAAEAYSGTLRDELIQFGVSVSTVEPGNFRSEIDASCLPFIKGEVLTKSRYSRELKTLVDSIQNSPEALHRTMFPPPRKVAEAVSDALLSANPRSRYLVGNRDELMEVIKTLLGTVSQVNRNHEHALDKEQLVKILFEQIES